MTDEQVAQLRELWPAGHSTAEISRRIGVTKSSVCGKARRLDLPKRKTHPNFSRRPGAGAAAVASAIAHTLPAHEAYAAARAEIVAARPPAPTPTPEPEVRLAGGRTCQWIEGSVVLGGRTIFCDQPIAFGQSWCPEHLRRVYVRVNRQRGPE